MTDPIATRSSEASAQRVRGPNVADPGTDVDVMAELAPLVPITVIAAMLGVPAEDTERFRHWTDAFVATFNPTIVGAERDHCVATSLELFDYLAAQVEDRRINPADDLITLAGTTSLQDGAPLTVSRAVAQLALLLAAGNETTANLIGNGMTLLIDNPRVHRRALRRPGAAAAGGRGDASPRAAVSPHSAQGGQAHHGGWPRDDTR